VNSKEVKEVETDYFVLPIAVKDHIGNLTKGTSPHLLPLLLRLASSVFHPFLFLFLLALLLVVLLTLLFFLQVFLSRIVNSLPHKWT
jgi:hypothetical protein